MQDNIQDNTESPLSSPRVTTDIRQVNWPPIEEIRAKCQCGRPEVQCRCAGTQGPYHCPACKSDTPTLSLTETKGANGGTKTLWHCHGGCLQEAVTQALYESLFPDALVLNNAKSEKPHGESGSNAAPNSVATGNVATNGTELIWPYGGQPLKKNLTTCRFKTLRQRGVSPQTQRDFQIESHAGAGLLYPAPFVSGSEPAIRGKGLRPDLPLYFWNGGVRLESDGNGNEFETFPEIYNLEVITSHEKRKGRIVYVVKSEPEVWTMHGAGLAAVCFLAADPDVGLLIELLQQAHIDTFHVILGNDVAGRQLALRLFEAGEAAKMKVKVRLLHGPLGFDVSDLYESLGFNATRFRDAITEIEYVPKSMRLKWQENINFELPMASSDEEESDDTRDVDEDWVRFWGEDDLESLPRPEYLVEGIIQAQGTTLLVGHPYTGKSALAMGIAVAVSAGLPWCGRATQKGLAFYGAGEGWLGLGKRFMAWKNHFGLQEVPNFIGIGQALPLGDEEFRNRLIAKIQRFSQRRGELARLLILDTLALNIGGADENQAGEMAQFIEGCKAVSLATGITVLCLHHLNAQGKVRGSTALPGNGDGVLIVEGESDSEVIKLHTRKIRDFGTVPALKLRREVVVLEHLLDKDGKPETSVVFVLDTSPDAEFELDGGSTSRGRRGRRLKAPKSATGATNSGALSLGSGEVKLASDGLSDKERASLDALHTLCASAAEGATFRAWEEAAKAGGVSKASFARAKKSLVDRRLVTGDEPGKVGARFTPASKS